MKLTIPFKTPSVNHLYFVWQGRKILTKEARILDKKIAEIVNPFRDFYLENTQLKVRIIILEKWFNLDGTIKKKDLDDRAKFILDSVFRGLNIDDKNVFELEMKKEHSDTLEEVEVYIDEV